MRATLDPGQSGVVGPLTADTAFDVKKGTIFLSSDGGATEFVWVEGPPFVFASGLTVNYRNARSDQAILDWMAV